MNPLLLALLGSAALVVATRARAEADANDTGLIVDSGTMTLAELDRVGKPVPSGYKVVCPSKLPNLPAHAPPQTAFGNWTAPCDVQKVANVPPPPFFGCGPLGCYVLPDGTPLYQYRPDGKTVADYTGEKFRPSVNTWFGGVPLNYPPVQETGVAAYSYIPQPGVPAPAGNQSTLYRESAAPYAWRTPVAPKAYASTAKAYAALNRLPPKLVASPINPAREPYVPKQGGLSDAINSLQSFACNALTVGLSLAPHGVELLGAKSKFGQALVNAESQGKTFYSQICGE